MTKNNRLTSSEKDILNSTMEMFISCEDVVIDDDTIRGLRSIAKKLNLKGEWLSDLEDFEAELEDSEDEEDE